ncbi:feruloyl-CoA synthase [Wenxinia saemankumensis]|uniref:Trans-feruloyl-CoA synthase n=1 Tax=Wenxinia saemankumensis TaxID=1447782 RepID=A0A1M6HNY8_9RHOB|nr:feruloyl-CoA synthase [Wenxinia saemankumensis]SHJ23846.1 trans-feruloyl-CoA synthase [Wenxinia saemankumensis]
MASGDRPHLWRPRIVEERRPDGSILVRQADPLPEPPARLADRILHWAEVAPDRTWMADRDGADWRRMSYAGLATAMRSVGGALLEMGLSVDRPLMILSGNSLDHAIVAVAAQFVGIPSAALAPAYALSGGAYEKLRDVAAQLTPGAVFVEAAGPFAPAIGAAFGPDIPAIVSSGTLDGRPVHILADLMRRPAEAAAEAAYRRTGPDTVAKFLFTSGTTGSPKAVIQTQRMICANMEMVRDAYPFLAEEPPVLVDWPPWNHVASGNKAFNLVLYNGGTFHVDRGNPGPAGIRETIRNLREVSPTWYFNVPVGYDALVREMGRDPELKRSFFARLRLMMYAGAGMAQHTWDDLHRLSQEATGAEIPVSSGLGATETAPFALFCGTRQARPGNVGVPARGLEAKLVPVEDKLELRLRGPSITPGYWRAPELTAGAFDEEGFYRLGDAVRYAVPGDAAAGFLFDGRIAENFKLDTGTWVAVGALRAGLVDALGGMAADAVIAGEGRAELGALIVPARAGFEAAVPGGSGLADAALYRHPAAEAALRHRLAALAERATGSSTRICRARVLLAPLSLDRGEVTDKGSVNQRRVLRERPDDIAALYEGGPGTILL